MPFLLFLNSLNNHLCNALYWMSSETYFSSHVMIIYYEFSIIIKNVLLRVSIFSSSSKTHFQSLSLSNNKSCKLFWSDSDNTAIF